MDPLNPIKSIKSSATKIKWGPTFKDSNVIILIATFSGPVRLLQRYALGINFTITEVGSNAVQRLVHLKRSLQSYLSLRNANEIAIVDFAETPRDYTMYVSCTYYSHTYTRSSEPKDFDAKSFYTKLLHKIFEPDGKTLKGDFLLAFGDSYDVTRVERSGDDFPPIALEQEALRIDITPCQQLLFRIEKNIFQDFEDGDARGLGLRLVRANFRELEEGDWVRLSRGQMTIYGYPRMSESGGPRYYRYKLVATDSNKQTVSELFNFIPNHFNSVTSFLLVVDSLLEFAIICHGFIVKRRNV